MKLNEICNKNDYTLQAVSQLHDNSHQLLTFVLTLYIQYIPSKRTHSTTSAVQHITTTHAYHM